MPGDNHEARCRSDARLHCSVDTEVHFQQVSKYSPQPQNKRLSHTPSSGARASLVQARRCVCVCVCVDLFQVCVCWSVCACVRVRVCACVVMKTEFVRETSFEVFLSFLSRVQEQCLGPAEKKASPLSSSWNWPRGQLFGQKHQFTFQPQKTH